MLLRATLVVLILLLLTDQHSKAGLPYKQLAGKTYAQRAPLLLGYYYEDLHNSDSVTIFRQIDSIRQIAEQNNDKDLLSEAALMRAHYFYYREPIFSRQQIVGVLDSLHQRAIKEKQLWLEIMAENMLALYHFNSQYYELAFVHHQRVYNLIKNIDPKDFPHKQNCLMQMAMEHYKFRDYREAIFYIREALLAEPPQPMTILPTRLSMLNTIGLAYQKMGLLDSADYYFNHTITEARQKKDSVWVCISSGNLGYSYFLRKQYERAIPLLEKDVRYAVVQQDWSLASGSQMVLGAISLERKEIARAWEQLQLARQFVSRSKEFNRKEILYPLLAKLYAFRGSPEQATLFLDSALLVRDSVSRAFNSLQLLRARQQVQIEQHNAEMESVQSKRRINLLERNILVTLIALFMIGSVLIYKNQQKKNRLQQMQAEKDHEELLLATKQLADFAKNMAEKNDLIELLQQQQGQTNESLISQLQQSTILTDEDWEYFRGLFEKVHGGFLARLREKLPGLTPAETRFIVLTRLGLSGKEMAAMLGIGSDAIRQLRSRVRKKLDLSEDQNIGQFTASI